jgi:hypothetical protein
MRILASATILLALGTVPLLSQENKPSTLKGVVTSEDGRALRATFVLLHDYQSHDWETRTEADGGSSFVLDAGCYDIFVSNAVFLPFSKRICVPVENGSVFRIKLRKDPHPQLRVEE